MENQDLFGGAADSEAARAKMSGLTHLLNIEETLMGAAGAAKKSESVDEDYESGSKDANATDFSNIEEAIDSDSSSGSDSDQENAASKEQPVRGSVCMYLRNILSFDVSTQSNGWSLLYFTMLSTLTTILTSV